MSVFAKIGRTGHTLNEWGKKANMDAGSGTR